MSDASRDGEMNARCHRLIERMCHADDEGLAEFYDLTLGKTYGLALRITGSAADAEDVVAETYIQAWQQAARYDPDRGAPLGWLLEMCRSRAIDHLRRRDPAFLHPSPELLRNTLKDSHIVTDVVLLDLIERDRHKDLFAALAQLPPLSRELLGLAFFGGYTHKEIAGITQLPLGTVKSHVRRALIAMRATLGERP